MTESWQEVAERIHRGDFTNIVVCTGAGVSTNSGIPDYRSEGGVFDKIREAYPEMARDPTRVLTRNFQNSHPDFQLSSFWTSFMDTLSDCNPTESHKLCLWLHDKCWLKRVYTQNVDGLHTKCGLPASKVVEFHGHLPISSAILYDEPIHEDSLTQLFNDLIRDEEDDNLPSVDLMLVMGTTLLVSPFCVIPNLVKESCTRVYVSADASSIRAGSRGEGGLANSSPFKFSGKTKDGKNLKRVVSGRSWWGSTRSKWRTREYIFELDCDDFSRGVISSQ